jgi:hypothetical protein
MERCLQLIHPFNNTGLVEKNIGPCWSCIDQPSVHYDKLSQLDKKFIANVNSMTPVKLNTYHRFRYHFGVFSPSLQEIATSMLRIHPIEYWCQYQAVYVTIDSFKINGDGSGYTGSAILYPMNKLNESKPAIMKRKYDYEEIGSTIGVVTIESSYIDRPEKRLRF